MALACRRLPRRARARKLLGCFHRQPADSREVHDVTPEMQSGTSMRESLRWMDMPELWVVVLVLVPLLALIAWIGYSREPISGPWRKPTSTAASGASWHAVCGVWKCVIAEP